MAEKCSKCGAPICYDALYPTNPAFYDDRESKRLEQQLAEANKELKLLDPTPPETKYGPSCEICRKQIGCTCYTPENVKRLMAENERLENQEHQGANCTIDTMLEPELRDEIGVSQLEHSRNIQLMVSRLCSFINDQKQVIERLNEHRENFKREILLGIVRREAGLKQRLAEARQAAAIMAEQGLKLCEVQRQLLRLLAEAREEIERLKETIRIGANRAELILGHYQGKSSQVEPMLKILIGQLK